MPIYAITMLAAGIGIPVLAAMNAALGRSLGAPMLAGVVLIAVGLLTASLVAMTQGPSALVKLATAPKHLFFAGVLLAFYVLSITAIAPKFGVGNAIFFVLIGQLISAAVIDHFGLFGAQQIPLTWTRLSGLLLMAAGVLLTQKPKRPVYCGPFASSATRSQSVSGTSTSAIGLRALPGSRAPSCKATASASRAKRSANPS